MRLKSHILGLLFCSALLSACNSRPPPLTPPKERDAAEISETRYPDENAPKLAPVPKGSVIATMTFQPTEKVVTDKPCLLLDLYDQPAKKPFLKSLSVRGRELFYTPKGDIERPGIAFKLVLRESDLPKIKPLQIAKQLTFKCTKYGKSDFVNKASDGFVELKVPYSIEAQPNFDAPNCAYLAFEDFPKNKRTTKRYRISAISTTTIWGPTAAKAHRKSGSSYYSALTIQVPKKEAESLNTDMAEHPYTLKCLERRKTKPLRR